MMKDATPGAGAPGHLGRDDRRAVEARPRPSWTRSRVRRTSARRTATGRRAASTTRSSPVVTADGSRHRRRGHPAGDVAREARRAASPPSTRTGWSPPATRRQISDGAAALLVMTQRRRPSSASRPTPGSHTVALAGVDPVIMLTGPIPATAKVLGRAGLTIDDIDAFEVNEAFASVSLAWHAETGADPAKRQRARRRHRARPPARRLGCPADDDPAAPAASAPGPLRPADDVRGRRHGQRDDRRAGVAERRQTGASDLSGESADPLARRPPAAQPREKRHPWALECMQPLRGGRARVLRGCWFSGCETDNRATVAGRGRQPRNSRGARAATGPHPHHGECRWGAAMVTRRAVVDSRSHHPTNPTLGGAHQGSYPQGCPQLGRTTRPVITATWWTRRNRVR